MSLRADTSDPAIRAAYQDVLNNATDTNWVLVGYAPRSNSKLQVVGTGSGGWEEMTEDMPESKVLFGFCRFEIKSIFRYAYLAWCGEGVQGMVKGSFNNHAHDMQRVFVGFHVQVNGRNEDDLDEKTVIKKLTTAIGAAYEAGDTKGRGAAPKSVADAQDAITRAPEPRASGRTLPSIDKEASEKFWNEEQSNQAKAPAKAERKIDVKANTGGLRAAFEQKAVEQAEPVPQPKRTGVQWEPKPAPEPAAPPPKPAPAARAPAPKAAAPAPAPAPAPKPAAPAPAPKPAAPAPAPKPVAPPPPEPTYEEEAYDEAAYDEGEAEAYDEGEAEAYDEGEAEAYHEAEEAYAEEPAYHEAEAEAEAYHEGEEAYAEEAYGEEAYAEEGGYVAVVRALYDFNGENDTDLSFHAGDIINVIDQSDPDGWWCGELNGVQGYFPMNFTESCE